MIREIICIGGDIIKNDLSEIGWCDMERNVLAQISDQ
jgi:hypothetical protein